MTGRPMPGAGAAAVLVLDATDTVATTLGALEAGRTIAVDVGGRAIEVTLAEAIPPGHKFAIVPVAAGAPVRKYGVVIGVARSAIAAGAHVHVHNLESRRGRGDRPAGR